jgi:hypothetical protein
MQMRTSQELIVISEGEDRNLLKIEYWTPRIVAAIGRLHDADTEKVEAFAALGDELLAAKKYLGYGKGSKFAAMLKQSSLNIGRRMADKYMMFARDKELRSIASKLPPAIDTIDKLGALPREQLRELIEDGTVTPKMRRVDVPRSRELPPKEIKPKTKTTKELQVELDSANSIIEQLRKQCFHSGDNIRKGALKLINGYGIERARRIARQVLNTTPEDVEDLRWEPAEGENEGGTE